jgi:hypothetical protein
MITAGRGSIVIIENEIQAAANKGISGMRMAT